MIRAQEPLISSFGNRSADDHSSCHLDEVRGTLTYAPIVSERNFTFVEIDVLLLRPGTPGFIAGGGGDIDNRLKTLFDSLQPPNVTDAYQPAWDQSIPVCCLVQDDKLITRVNVETDRLLDQTTSDNEVLLVIGVHVRASSPRECNHFAT